MSHIPQKLIQFWHSGLPPCNVHEAIKSWPSLHPGFAHQVFDDTSASEFIRRHFPSDVLAAYKQCAHPTLRADLFRYCALAIKGGVYVDADDRCLGSIHNWLEAPSDLVLLRKPNGRISNNFIACRALHPLLGRAVEQVTQNILQRSSYNIWEVSGPLVIDRIINASHCPGIRVLDFPSYRKLVVSAKKAHQHPLLPANHWSSFQRTQSIFRSSGDPEPAGLFGIIKRIPVLECTSLEHFQSTGMSDRQRVVRTLDELNLPIVGLRSVSFLNDTDFRISRWFYPLQLSLEFSCWFEAQMAPAQTIYKPLNYIVQELDLSVCDGLPKPVSGLVAFAQDRAALTRLAANNGQFARRLISDGGHLIVLTDDSAQLQSVGQLFAQSGSVRMHENQGSLSLRIQQLG